VTAVSGRESDHLADSFASGGEDHVPGLLHIRHSERDVREPWPIGSRGQGVSLAAVLVDLEGRSVRPETWQPQVNSTQTRASDAGPPLEILPGIIALWRHRLASQHADVEIREPSPVEGDEVGVDVFRRDRPGHDQILSL